MDVKLDTNKHSLFKEDSITQLKIIQANLH